MKKSLLVIFLSFPISFLFAQRPDWINQNSRDAGMAKSVLHPFSAEGSAGKWINSNNEPGTCLQKLLQVAGEVKKTSSPGDIVYLPDTVFEWYGVPAIDSTRYIFIYNSMGLLKRGTIEKSGISSKGEWLNNELDTCTYDSNGNMLSVLIRLWTNGAWTNSSLVKHTYDANGHILTESEATWLNDQWTNTYRNTYIYYANGNKQTALAERWLNNQWTNSTRYIWTYDAQGNNLTYLYEQWLNEQWTNSLRFTKTYDGKGDNLVTLNESWTNGQWMNTLLDSCTFNAKGNRLSEHIWGWVVNHWKDSLLENLTYNGNGKILTDTTYTFANGLTKVYMENIFSYDASGNCISTLTQGFFYINWDYSKLYWQTLTDTCKYDADGRILDDLREFLHNGVYIPIRRYSYTYDAIGNLLTVSHAGSLDWNMYNKLIYINAGDYIYLLSYWDPSVFIKISYKQMVITDVPSLPGGTIIDYSLSQPYPNPFSSATTIKYKVTKPGFVSLKVFDSMGTEVASLVNEHKPKGDYSIGWNATGLAEGIYFCRLQSGTFSETKKLVLQK
jgi:hypothetical protein